MLRTLQVVRHRKHGLDGFITEKYHDRIAAILAGGAH